MQFSTTLLLAALSVVASAQNPFTFTTLTSVTAGTPFNITWEPTTGTVDTVTLVLRQGDPTSLTTIAIIAPSMQNTGSYLWTPPTTLVAGPLYAFEIVDDGNTAITNYSKQFSIISTNTVSSSILSITSSTSSISSSTTGVAATTLTGSASSTSSGRTTGSRTSTANADSTRTLGTGTSTGTPAASSATGRSAAGSVKVGVGLLGVVGAGMALL